MYSIRERKLICVIDERGEVHSCKIQLFSSALRSVESGLKHCLIQSVFLGL